MLWSWVCLYTFRRSQLTLTLGDDICLDFSPGWSAPSGVGVVARLVNFRGWRVVGGRRGSSSVTPGSTSR
jgi:hypothetical protein